MSVNKKLPSFVIAGAQRCGTTWLYNNLIDNPDIFLSKVRKEIHFFDDNYEKGLQWYESYFEQAKEGQAIGDVTPKYIYEECCAHRIYDVLGRNVKIIVILRHPVDRAISQFKLYVRDKGYDANDFNYFLENNPDAIERGFYAKQLKRFFETFGTSNVLVCNFDDLYSNPQSVLGDICNFIGVTPHSMSVVNASNESFIPKHQLSYKFTKLISDWLRSLGFDSLVERFKSTGFIKLYGKSKKKVIVSIEDKNKLEEKYSDSIKELNQLLDGKFAHWDVN